MQQRNKICHFIAPCSLCNHLSIGAMREDGFKRLDMETSKLCKNIFQEVGRCLKENYILQKKPLNVMWVHFSNPFTKLEYCVEWVHTSIWLGFISTPAVICVMHCSSCTLTATESAGDWSSLESRTSRHFSGALSSSAVSQYAILTERSTLSRLSVHTAPTLILYKRAHCLDWSIKIATGSDRIKWTPKENIINSCFHCHAG